MQAASSGAPKGAVPAHAALWLPVSCEEGSTWGPGNLFHQTSTGCTYACQGRQAQETVGKVCALATPNAIHAVQGIAALVRSGKVQRLLVSKVPSNGLKALHSQGADTSSHLSVVRLFNGIKCSCKVTAQTMHVLSENKSSVILNTWS